MKTLKQIREEYNSNFLSVSTDEIMLEATGDSKQKSRSFDVPSPQVMPTLLMFRRVTYRKYPDHQTVALYYSKAVDKYLSIPFGPTGNLNINEATIYDTIEELDLCEGAKWEAVKGGVKGAAHGAAKGFYRGAAVAAEPGAAIGGVVGAVHGAYKGAKKAYDKSKDEMHEDWQSVNRKDKTDGLSQKAVNAYRRENPGSKLKTAVTEKNPTGKRASRRKSFCSRMGGMKKRLTSAKTARDPDSRINKALRRWNCEESFKSKLEEKRTIQNENLINLAIKAYGAYKTFKNFTKNFTSGGSDEDQDQTKQQKKSNDNSASNQQPEKMLSTDIKKSKTKVTTPGMNRGDSPIDKSRHNTVMRKEYDAARKKEIASIAENKISDIRSMINSGETLHEMNINGRSVTLNTSMAKRILEVYDSVNTKNKKIVESMLNEDLESFKKLLNFSIRK
jgi:hypothetical protein